MKIEFPENLPINQQRKEIAELIKQHQVVVIAGETGSGKTTQLPKICLSLGLAQNGCIGHTQPRRIAARSVADRIASELNVNLGVEVGYQVRFSDNSSDKTQLKLMTDGVLLAEMQRDRLLRKYSVIIIDEAHERSLNIDFLLGLLKSICKQRPELKLIITSATIDLERFAKHFAINDTPAPIIEVSGRTYPVQTVYRPIEDDQISLAESISHTVQHIARAEAKGEYKARGDVLVFCAGEREIREAATAIKRADLPVVVLPLYSRLSVQEQNKIFQPAHRRKVVLATNVAETSITVPGIAYVIDPGVARISRYSFRSKIQRLPIERISQASANQRQGRCGRVANGVCIRLYSQEDFEQRSEFTQAEILRSNLASVILKMMQLNIKEIDRFDFIDKPDSRLLNDGKKLLEELQAIEPVVNRKTQQSQLKLTEIGRHMCNLPIEPKFARILVAANALGCLRDALVLISVLSIQDPRERPTEHQQAADQKHKELHHPQSDFFTLLYLWQKINNERETLSNAQFKKHCLKQYWSIARIFEWRELSRQLAQMCKEQGWKIEPWQTLELPQQGNSRNVNRKEAERVHFDARYTALHQALVCGLMGNIARKDVEGEYLATRSRRIHLFASSSQAKRKPSWLVAGEYLETSRVFAINAAQINPAWVIQQGQHLLRYSYSAPYYHVRSGTIKAARKTLFQGLILKDNESVNYSSINQHESRQIFIQEALVAQRYQPRSQKAEFVSHNQRLINDIEEVEAKTRRRNLLIGDQEIHAYFDKALPDHITSRAALEKWLSKGNQATLKLKREQLLNQSIDSHELAQFPNTIEVQGKEIKVQYQFNPGQPNDGVTLVLPVSVLAPFPAHRGDWLVPGLLAEKCVALIKTLPKPIRRHYAPANDTVQRILPKLSEPSNELKSLTAVLADILYRTRGVKVCSEDFATEKLDNYYQVNYQVTDTNGSKIGESRDLSQLKRDYADAVQATLTSDTSIARRNLEQHNMNDWRFDDLPNTVQYQHEGMTVQAYPMLKVVGPATVSLLIHDQADIARYHTHFGVLELAKAALSSGSQKQAYRYLQKELMRTQPQKSANKTRGLGQLAAQLKTAAPTAKASEQRKENWVNELILASLNQTCFDGNAKDIKSQSSFKAGLNKAKHWVANATELEATLLRALRTHDRIQDRMTKNPATSIDVDEVYEDIKAQLHRLFHPSFLRYTTAAQLQQYARYLKAIECRLDKIALKEKLAQGALILFEHQANFDAFCQSITPPGFEQDFALLLNPKLKQFSILLEEWRVSLYAQHLGTQQSVSDKRLRHYWQNEVINTE